jgi:hypothetical protein
VAAKHKLSAADVDALINARHPEPRSLLGYHEVARTDEQPLCLVRALEPDAYEVDVCWDDGAPPVALTRIHDAGLFEGRVPFRRPLHPYRLRVRYKDGNQLDKHDPYYFAPQLSDFDLYLFGEGNHYSIYYKLGAHPTTLDGLDGTRFAVWAPNAERVSVVGPFNLWDGRRHAMQVRGSSGIWELFIPGVGPGTEYKYELRTRSGGTVLKADPYGFAMQLRPGNCSVVASLDGHDWGDYDWKTAIAKGMEYAGLPFSGEFDFTETQYMFQTTHMVAPKEKSLSCTECHSSNGRLAKLGWFYMPGRDSNRALNVIGWGAVIVALIAVLGHGAGRLVSRKRREKKNEQRDDE